MAKNYKIGFLGIKGEGKTIYLSSLYFMLDNRFYDDDIVNAFLGRNNDVNYITDSNTVIGRASNWNTIVQDIGGTEGNMHNIGFNMSFKDNDYNLRFFDYMGGHLYHNVELAPELIENLRELHGIIIIVSEKNFNATLHNFHRDWVQSIQRIYDQIGKKPSVLIMTQGDITQENLGHDIDVQRWFKDRTNVFKQNMIQYAGSFDVFVKSAKSMFEYSRRGLGPMLNGLHGSLRDLGEPMFALLELMDEQSYIRKTRNMLSEIEDLFNSAKQNLREIQELSKTKEDVTVLENACKSEVDSLERMNNKAKKMLAAQKTLKNEEVKKMEPEVQELHESATIAEENTNRLLESAKNAESKKDNSWIKYVLIIVVIVVIIGFILSKN